MSPPLVVWGRQCFAAVVGFHGLYDGALEVGADPRAPEILGRMAIGVLVPALLAGLYWACNRACRASPYRK